MRGIPKSVGVGVVAMALGGLMGNSDLAGQTLTLPVDDGGWEIAGDAAVGQVDGRTVLNLRQANVERAGLTFTDGTIEFDMKVTGRRTFIGVKFRAEDGTGEDIYFRPHKSGLPDAIQYDATFQEAGGWQLYHGPDATAFAWYEPGTWTHVRVEVKGEQAAVFLGDSDEPALVTHHLRSGRTSGRMGFWATQPGATQDDPWTVSLADVTVRRGETRYAFAPQPAEEPAVGIIRRWSLSAGRQGEAADLDALPADLDGGRWTTGEAEPTGLLNLDHLVKRPERGPALAFARIRIRAESARTVRLDLGYSDNTTVFLDGRPVFTGRFSYSYNFPRRDGLITPDQATAHLSLTPGDHEVVVAVSDVFGGWGLMGRILDRNGIQILEPRRLTRTTEASVGAGAHDHGREGMGR